MFDKKKLEDFTTHYLQQVSTTPVGLLTLEQAEHTYIGLIDVIGYHNWLYYIASQSIIADGQYDSLFKYLQDIETRFPEIIRDDSPTQRLTYQLQDSFHQAIHPTPLLSLENSYNAEDLIAWDESITKLLAKEEISGHTFICEPKYDGISVELVYENGMLVQAITRGDGYVGEDITNNLKTLFSIPIRLKAGEDIKVLRVRGEVVMSKKSLEKVNEEREKEGSPLFANVRNAASGSLRQLDTGVTAKRGLTYFVYEILALEHTENVVLDFSTDTQALQWLTGQGFFTHTREKHCTSIQEVVNICTSSATKNYFDKQEIEFDGIVVKVNERAYREKLGSTNHHPRRAMAYKFPTKQIVTQLLSVDYQVGRTGVITPAGNLAPVELGGVTISRASLHNFDFIADKDIRIGDWVWLQRSGEVIPYVVASIPERRDGSEAAIIPPTNCPICGGIIEKGKSDIYVYCTNSICPAKLKGQILYFVSRDGLNIEGIGDSLVDLLIEKGFLHNIADLYTLDNPQARLQLLSMEGIGQKKYYELIEEIKKSKIAPVWRLLNGLGIMHIGKKTAQIITEAIAEKLSDTQKEQFTIYDLETFLCYEEFLLSVKGIGPETVASIKAWFADDQNKAILEQMAKYGVSRNGFDTKVAIKGKLTGQSFCITGTFALPRKVIADILTKHGARITETLTQQTSFLLVGEQPSSKLAKAQERGIPIIEGLERLEQKFDYLKNDIAPMKLFAKEKKNDVPRQEGLF